MCTRLWSVNFRSRPKCPPCENVRFLNLVILVAIAGGDSLVFTVSIAIYGEVVLWFVLV